MSEMEGDGISACASASGADLEEFFKTHFKTDNDYPRDFSIENKVIMDARASLLILSAIDGGRFAPFMKSGKRSTNRWIFELKTPIAIDVRRNRGIYKFIFRHVDADWRGTRNL